jgi:ankyrin repeat protein
MSKEFFEAIKQGDLALVQQMTGVDHSLVEVKDENGLSAIMIAAYHQRPEIAQWLAAQAITLSIFEAAVVGKVKDLIRIQARNPEMVGAFATDGFQPLGLAAFFGHTEAVDFLIKAGAMVNAVSRNGLKVTPLNSAAAGSHAASVKILLEHSADPNIQQSEGFTPLHAAADNGDLESIRLLLLHGADRRLTDKNGKTPYDYAVAKNHLEAAKLLAKDITKRLKTK